MHAACGSRRHGSKYIATTNKIKECGILLAIVILILSSIGTHAITDFDPWSLMARTIRSGSKVPVLESNLHLLSTFNVPLDLDLDLWYESR